jgi:polyisoprenoid-binding protein YceI
MRRSFLSLFVALFGLAALAAPVARGDDMKADPVHSFAVFDVHHFQAGYVYGTFAGPEGSVTYDDSDLTKTAVDMSVDVGTLDTRNENRDRDLRGPDWFDAKQFPKMTFKSTSATKTGDNTIDLTGDLTIKGVTKTITVPMEHTGTGKGMKGETRVGLRADFKINRRDFNMTAYPDTAIANEIHVIVAIEAIPAS